MDPAESLSRENLAIFLFHGVTEGLTRSPVRNYNRKHLEKDYFFRFVQRLKSVGHSLGMDEVVGHHASRDPFPTRSFAITFDDGFENNYSVAAPILNDLRVPATFYVTTGFVENNEMSWIDRIEYCLESAEPGRLTFPWDKTAYSFHDAEDKIRLLDYLRDHVKRDTSVDLDALVSTIFSQCGVEEIRANDGPLDLKMTWEQVAALHRQDNFIVGGHSHRHVILSFLNTEQLEAEIQVSMDALEQKAGISVQHYSYPEGLEHCYSAEVIQTLLKHGIVCCPTAEPGLNTLDDSLFCLKRIAVA